MITQKQKNFADYYIETGNAEEAARKAGYSARGNTTKLLQNTTIRTYMDERLKSLESEKIAKQDEILKFLTQVMRGEIKEQIPLGRGMGHFELEDKDTYVKDRIKAAELLGKRYMIWTENHSVEVDAKEQVKPFVDALTTAAEEVWDDEEE